MSAAVYRAHRGSGTTLLCLHGIGSSSASFTPQFEGLAAEHRVVAWDAPGYGRSADPTDPPDMAGYADVAADLIKDLGEPVHLLGVSWGGVIALQIALDHPSLLRSLLLVGASRGSGRSEAAADRMRHGVAQLIQLGPPAFAEQRAPALLSDNAEPALVEQATETMATAVRLPGYAHAAIAMADTDHSDRLGEITTPTIVLYGTADAVTGRGEALALADGIGDAACIAVPGAGHLANQERPAIVNAWIRAFLRITEGIPDQERSNR